jgi:hypothetical protein
MASRVILPAAGRIAVILRPGRSRVGRNLRQEENETDSKGPRENPLANLVYFALVVANVILGLMILGRIVGL